METQKMANTENGATFFMAVTDGNCGILKGTPMR